MRSGPTTCVSLHQSTCQAAHTAGAPHYTPHHHHLPQPPPLPSPLAGYLVPPYHSNYWLGLNTTSYEWPQFYWLDHSPPLGPLTYKNWGTLALADGAGFVPEPNNVYPPEYCVTANYSMMSGEGTWGWQDSNCTIGQFPFICKMTRERPAAADTCCAVLLDCRHLASNAATVCNIA